MKLPGLHFVLTFRDSGEDTNGEMEKTENKKEVKAVLRCLKSTVLGVFEQDWKVQIGYYNDLI